MTTPQQPALPYPVIRQVGECGGSRPVFEVVQDFSVWVNIGDDSQFSACIPKGTLTDFASVPRCLWWLINPMDHEVVVAGLVHDGAYLKGSGVSRSQADTVLRLVMDFYGARWWKQWVVCTAVRLCGWMCYPSEGIEDRRPRVIAAIRSGPHEE